MRNWLWTVGVGISLAGCVATTHTTTKTAAPADSGRRALLAGAAVHIVTEVPAGRRYQFVGRVAATTSTADLVDAAKAADAELRRQARALGADVITLDVIAPPQDDARPRRRVILAGRAYRERVN